MNPKGRERRGQGKAAIIHIRRAKKEEKRREEAPHTHCCHTIYLHVFFPSSTLLFRWGQMRHFLLLVMQGRQGRFIPQENTGMQRKRPNQRNRQPPYKHLCPFRPIALLRTIPGVVVHPGQGALHPALDHVNAIKRREPLDGPRDPAGEEEEVGGQRGAGLAFLCATVGVVPVLQRADGEVVLCLR